MSRRFRIMPAPRRGTPMTDRRLRVCRVCAEWRALYRGVCRSCAADLARAAAATSPVEDAAEPATTAGRAGKETRP